MTKTPVKRKVKKTIVPKKPKLGSKEAVLKKSEDIDLDTSDELLEHIGCKKYQMEMLENTALLLGEVLVDRSEQMPNCSSRLAKAAVMITVTPLEAMLATQMGATHTLVLAEAKRASHTEYLEKSRQHTNQATKLSRLFLEQVAAFQRLKGKGQQKIIVEKVTVESGGQAAIGVYEPRGGNVKK